jgi:cation:H+ antiporter
VTNSYLLFFLGVVCAGAGGELFVRGTVGLARWARVSPALVAVTIAAFATSSPELAVSVTAALSGAPQIALGDALGSNVVNIALVLGLVLVISETRAPRGSINRDFLVALGVPALIGLLALDGVLSAADGALLLSAFVAWLLVVLVEVLRQRNAAQERAGEHRPWLVVLATGAGLVLLVAAGRLIVIGATEIAVAFGMDQFVIGATVVALGTSAPEIATAVIAKLRGHDEVGLGTLLGSNIFNGLLIVAVASIISPIPVVLAELALALMLGFLATAVIYPARSGLIGRGRGVLLLAFYAVYLLIMLRPAP